MSKEVILIFAICVYAATTSPSGGATSSEISERTEDRSAHRFPFAVHIYTYISDTGHFGGGTLITSNAILCTAKQLEFGTVYEIGYGSHLKSEQLHRILYPKHVLYYPQYNSSLLTHNIAILRLPCDIPFDLNTKPVHLVSYRSYTGKINFVGVQATIVGWGGSDSLRYTTVLGISNELCATTYGENIVTSLNMCTRGYENIGHNACRGDAGGPLLIEENNFWTLIGVISFGYGCESDEPTGYTNIASYLDWIRHVTGVK